MTIYSDIDWADYPDSRHSTPGYCIYLDDNLISWSSKCQTTISRSSAEVEYRVVAHAVAKCCWLCQLLQKLYCNIPSATVVQCELCAPIVLRFSLSGAPTGNLDDVSFIRAVNLLAHHRAMANFDW